MFRSQHLTELKFVVIDPRVAWFGLLGGGHRFIYDKKGMMFFTNREKKEGLP
jgi:hypothetical protein